jgi:cobalt-zinc-cadmium efflux system membrane fusion protein
MRRLLLALTLLLAGCEKAALPPPEAPAAASTTELCREHGVLEAVCPKCNPKLAAVFQAKGDWCAEHGFPESFCPLCHPERGGRPAAEVAAAEGEPPAHGLKVRLASPHTAQIVGIDTEKARPTAGPDGFVAPARLAYDGGRRAEVNARSTGVVRSVLVDLGTRVRRGDPLVVLESAEVGADRSRLAAAHSREDVARAALARERALHAEGITPKRAVEEAESTLAEAEAEVQALQAAAAVVGRGAASRYTLTAPVSGTVVRRLATVGRQVDSQEILLEIADASVLWAEIDLPEARLGEVSVGDAVALSFAAPSGRGSPAPSPPSRPSSTRARARRPRACASPTRTAPCAPTCSAGPASPAGAPRRRPRCRSRRCSRPTASRWSSFASPRRCTRRVASSPAPGAAGGWTSRAA